jgi:hypothetical protein
MSAFLLGKRHIDTLVTHANLRRISGTEDRDAVGRMLIRENIASVEGRHPDTEGKPDSMPGEYLEADGYSFSTYGLHFTPAAVLKAIACYEYQSCEHKGWKDSKAAELCEALRHELINALPGYDDAEWEVL